MYKKYNSISASSEVFSHLYNTLKWVEALSWLKKNDFYDSAGGQPLQIIYAMKKIDCILGVNPRW